MTWPAGPPLVIDLQLTTTAAQHRSVAIWFMCNIIKRSSRNKKRGLRVGRPVCVVAAAAAAAGLPISNQVEFQQITDQFTAIMAPRGPTADKSFHGGCKRKPLAGRFPDWIQSGQIRKRYVIPIPPPCARAVNHNRGTFGGAFTFKRSWARAHQPAVEKVHFGGRQVHLMRPGLISHWTMLVEGVGWRQNEMNTWRTNSQIIGEKKKEQCSAYLASLGFRLLWLQVIQRAVFKFPAAKTISAPLNNGVTSTPADTLYRHSMDFAGRLYHKSNNLSCLQVNNVQKLCYQSRHCF